ncbi:hydroxyacid dehydrogenase [Paenalcaligenes niemegkensis]|uniref:hydroxyacid dehydrogenase n=1 Tax=Paenalcaligenes niemegkensis TaxID=2895469 RepID=UPI001EE7CBEE|nr:hydroxyacid dehydrogenase [Paenalcaligenes niemegkensis]MCQ9616042.1 hydroxyacid dehydrogenase [Paenalcaligenes niemegkensis]
MPHGITPPPSYTRRFRVLVTHHQIAPSAIAILNDNDCDVIFSPPYAAPEAVAAKAAELQIDAIMVRQGYINDLVIAASSNLKVIVKHGVGVDNIDIAAATVRNIPVLRSLGSNARSVAEHSISLTLALIKRIQPLDQAVKAGQWPKPSFIGQDIQGSLIGLIGFGAIGQETAKLALALGMKVLIYDPHANQNREITGLEFTENLDLLLKNVDVVSIHCPLNNETHHLLNAEKLALMKPSAVLVNTARGGVIDEAALVNALQNQQIAGAALDSFDVEPPAPEHSLWSCPNLIATPHIAGVTVGSAICMAETAARHIVSVLKGNPAHKPSLATVDQLALKRT